MKVNVSNLSALFWIIGKFKCNSKTHF